MSKTILLADDSVTIRKVVELTFMEEDYELVSLGGGEEAIQRLAEVDPDLVVADVHMPGVTGYDVCRAAKEHRPERPVLLLVGTFEPFDADEMRASGADGHLKKPFDSQELLQTVRDLLAAGGGPAEPAAAEEPAAVTLEEPALAEDLAVAAVDESGEMFAEPQELALEEVGPGGEEEPAVEESVVAAVEAEETTVTGNGAPELSDQAVERIARRVAELLGPEAVRDVAWEVVPDLAEVVIKERLRELEGQVE